MLVAVWVEEVEGMKNLDEILQVPGIDAVNIASGDLALSMGLPGRSDHPDVQAAVAEARKKVLAAGKVVIGEPSDATHCTANDSRWDSAHFNGSPRDVGQTRPRAYLNELQGESH